MQPIFALFIKAEIRIIKQKTKSNKPYFIFEIHPIFAPFTKADIEQIEQNAKQISPSFPIIYKQIITSI